MGLDLDGRFVYGRAILAVAADGLAVISSDAFPFRQIAASCRYHDPVGFFFNLFQFFHNIPVLVIYAVKIPESVAYFFEKQHSKKEQYSHFHDIGQENEPIGCRLRLSIFFD